ncbi:MAG TPA: sulfatase-like hydrolase/transferase [Polyangiaceae bacterium]|nr:sulfatase-like hydrolase/transferase [Polyangiaceae bacterium]
MTARAPGAARRLGAHVLAAWTENPDLRVGLAYVLVLGLLRADFIWLGDSIDALWRAATLALVAGAVEDVAVVALLFGAVPRSARGSRVRLGVLAFGVLLTVVNLCTLAALNVPFDPLMLTYLSDPLQTSELQSPVPLGPLFLRLFLGLAALAGAYALRAWRPGVPAAPFDLRRALRKAGVGVALVLFSRGLAGFDYRATQVSHADGFAWLWFQLGRQPFGLKPGTDLRKALLTPAALGESLLVDARYPLVRGSRYALCHAGLQKEGCSEDADRDGVPLELDCNDRDPSIHPGALDVPDDGIDQDCSGLDAMTPDVLVLELEGMPARVLAETGARGADAVATELGALARRPDARLFTHYETAAAQTGPGFASAMCSLLPHYGAGMTRGYAGRGVRCLPGMLGELGYQTLMVQNGDPRFDNQQAFAQRAGFARIEGAVDIERALGHAPRVTKWGVADAALFEHLGALLRARKPSDPPLFLLSQSITNHYPYVLPDPKYARPGPGTPLWQKVRSTSAYVDAALGDFIRALDALTKEPGRRPLLVAMSGDHGHPSELHRGNRAPASALYDENVHTPLVVWAPGRPGRLARLDAAERNAPCSSVDLMPTLLGLVGVDGVTASMGRDLALPSSDADRRAISLNPLGGGLVRIRRSAGSVVVRALPPALEAFAPSDADELDDLGARAPFGRALADEALAAVFAAKALIEEDRIWSDTLLPKRPGKLAALSGEKAP